MRDYLGKNLPVHFVFPIDGDCLNQHDGFEKDGKLVVRAKVFAPKDALIYINEVKAEFDGEFYVADVVLEGYRNTLWAEDLNNKEHYQKIKVYDFRHATKKFRISADDNLLFLKDITDNKDIYTSIFDNPYLKMYKEAHDKYGAKVHLNLFYETDEMPYFSEKFYFNLSMVTDKFKDEWVKNSSWLKLSFHADKERPANPYQNTTIEKITKDVNMINNEIIRFAGEETLAKNVVTVHWGECNYKGMSALRALGFKCLVAYFTYYDNKPLASFCFPTDLVDHVNTRDFWVNTDDDLLFGRTDIVLNQVKNEDLLARLEEIKSDPHISGFIELMIHEQYFYETYKYYKPDFTDVILNSAKWAYENGYKPVFMEELLEKNN